MYHLTLIPKLWVTPSGSTTLLHPHYSREQLESWSKVTCLLPRPRSYVQELPFTRLPAVLEGDCQGRVAGGIRIYGPSRETWRCLSATASGRVWDFQVVYMALGGFLYFSKGTRYSSIWYLLRAHFMFKDESCPYIIKKGSKLSWVKKDDFPIYKGVVFMTSCNTGGILATLLLLW